MRRGYPNKPGGGGAETWKTVFEMDFSAQANQSLGTDGTYVIGGTTFRKLFSAFQSGTPAVVNGQGIVMSPSSSSAWTMNGAFSSQLSLLLPIQGVFPAYNPLKYAARLWTLFDFGGGFNPATNLSGSAQGFVPYPTNNNNWVGQTRLGKVTTSVSGLGVGVFSDHWSLYPLTVTNTDNVIVTELQGDAASVLGTKGSWAGAWPDHADYEAQAQRVLGSGTASNRGAPPPASVHAFFGPTGITAGGTFTVTYRRMRLDLLKLPG